MNAGMHEITECKRLLEEFVISFPTSPLLKEATEIAILNANYIKKRERHDGE